MSKKCIKTYKNLTKTSKICEKLLQKSPQNFGKIVVIKFPNNENTFFRYTLIK